MLIKHREDVDKPLRGFYKPLKGGDRPLWCVNRLIRSIDTPLI